MQHMVNSVLDIPSLAPFERSTGLQQIMQTSQEPEFTCLVKADNIQLPSQCDGVRPSHIYANLPQPANAEDCCNGQAGWQCRWHSNGDHVKEPDHNASGLSTYTCQHNCSPDEDTNASHLHITSRTPVSNEQ